ncbi:MAG: response regulator transcription factor [Eubacteriaceae bacterium]|nr:response regulator transcription factor [Eubacteriaceae bacterium]
MKQKILIVDDEAAICELLEMELTLEGYDCMSASDGILALSAFDSYCPDLILLDIMLPGINGYEVLKRITAKADVPIIMLTAKAQTADIIEGLETGAHDYITKPFETSELLARIKAALRRHGVKAPPSADILKNGSLTVIPSSRSVYVEQTPVRLTVTEFEILLIFMRNYSKVLSRKDLAMMLGEENYDELTRAIDMHIQRLRRKLSKVTAIRFIETVHGLGYKMRNFDEAEI